MMACAMGGVVGMERELRHKQSGLRTNMLVCMASALFTVMSIAIAGDSSPNKGQIASNIVQGVGFLGAGLILHNKSRVQGLTTAATIFVVAAIGMACGAGMYLEALLATVLVLLALFAVGALEAKAGWQRFPMLYEVRAEVGSTLPADEVGPERATKLEMESQAARHRMYTAILKVLDAAGVRLDLEDRGNVAGLERVSFTVLATRRTHARLLQQLRASDDADQVVVFRDVEDE